MAGHDTIRKNQQKRGQNLCWKPKLKEKNEEKNCNSPIIQRITENSVPPDGYITR